MRDLRKWTGSTGETHATPPAAARRRPRPRPPDRPTTPSPSLPSPPSHAFDPLEARPWILGSPAGSEPTTQPPATKADGVQSPGPPPPPTGSDATTTNVAAQQPTRCGPFRSLCGSLSLSADDLATPRSRAGARICPGMGGHKCRSTAPLTPADFISLANGSPAKTCAAFRAYARRTQKAYQAKQRQKVLAASAAATGCVLRGSGAQRGPDGPTLC